MSGQTKSSEIDWEKSSQQLHKRIIYKVYQMKLPRWQGEEDDIAWDIVQESIRKFLEYMRKVEKGEEKPVQERESLLYVIALNCLKDRRRREIRLCSEAEYICPVDSRIYLSEVATENVYQERLFYLLAQKIARFPAKQRDALLADLASRMAFDEKPTTLQAAFRAEGIRLEEYRSRLPGQEKRTNTDRRQYEHPETEYRARQFSTDKERSRHAALLYQATRRLRELKELHDKDIQTYLEEEHRETCRSWS